VFPSARRFSLGGQSLLLFSGPTLKMAQLDRNFSQCSGTPAGRPLGTATSGILWNSWVRHGVQRVHIVQSRWG
jgi:hypothetical protein